MIDPRLPIGHTILATNMRDGYRQGQQAKITHYGMGSTGEPLVGVRFDSGHTQTYYYNRFRAIPRD